VVYDNFLSLLRLLFFSDLSAVSVSVSAVSVWCLFFVCDDGRNHSLNFINLFFSGLLKFNEKKTSNPKSVVRRVCFTCCFALYTPTTISRIGLQVTRRTSFYILDIARKEEE
jgi:hypothetical protein